MKYSIYKKILVLILGIFLILVTIVPTFNAKILNGTKFEISLLKDNENSDSEYDLLIIAPKKFCSILRPLVFHKNLIGVKTKLVSLSQIYLSKVDQGRDNAEKIKYFIKDYIENFGIEYVLLVGGMKHQGPSWHLPVRYVSMDDGWESHYVSDLYYADIYDKNDKFSSWDSDEDGIFGEWFSDEAEDKNIDLYPDIAIGRLPARNIFEVIVMVKKIIMYERTAYDKSWFNDMVVIAGDTYPEHQNANWTGYEGEYYADLALENMSDFNQIKLYTSDQTLTGPDDVIKTISKGCGFLYFVGHGNPMTWGNHPPDNESFITGLSVNHMPRLFNGNKLPICVVSGCHNCQFDVTILKIFDSHARIWGEATPEGWGWWITRKIGGGSIATIGCTALGYTKEDKDSFEGGLNWIEVEFFKEYGQNNIDIIGDTWKAAVNSYLDTFPQIDWDSPTGSDSFIDTKVVQSWILFGDPSLKIGGYE